MESNSRIARGNNGTSNAGFAADRDSRAREQLVQENMSGRQEPDDADEWMTHPMPGSDQRGMLRSGAFAGVIFKRSREGQREIPTAE
jgi:hypothetical protein